MKVELRRLALYLGIVLALAALLGLSASRSAPAGRGVKPGAKSATAVPNIVGHWVGTWQDTVYSVSGALVFNFTDMSNGTGQIDLTALGLGVEFGTAVAATSNDTLYFSFTSTNVGGGGGAIIGNYTIGAGTVGAPLNFGAFTFEGHVTTSAMDGRFYYLSPTGGAGRASLSKTSAVEEHTWGSIKSLYSSDAP
jgi:hypothetical protein